MHPSPFHVGRHTAEIGDMIDEAIAAYRNGVSTFLTIHVPFRHGKSDLISRYLPPRWLGLFPDTEVLLATYGQELASDLSRDARAIFASDMYQRTFRDVRLSDESSAVNRWSVADRLGKMAAVGLGGPMTGRGYSLGIVDDYFKSREQAESLTIREKVWDSFTNDFMTRRAPVSVTIVLATRWHIDDLIGRIEAAMKSEPKFPRFRNVIFPAFSDEYQHGVLFHERFSRDWYDTMAATLGAYGTAALLQGNPIPRTGAVFKTDRVVIDETMDTWPKNLEFVRGWDLASTEKDVLKSDPDYTVGMLAAVDWIAGPAEGLDIPRLWIADVVRGRWEAPERDRKIVQCAQIDGENVRIACEAVGGYKDTYARIRDLLRGIRSVEAITPAQDKLVRASPLEPIFEAGNVHVLRGAWNRDLLSEVGIFPAGTHDDQVDAMTVVWAAASQRGIRVGVI
jgi:predicted phage terminase large subunit-like protein